MPEYDTDGTPDMSGTACMADAWDKVQKLKDPVAGCPNFRRIPGYKVYCCGQPTVAGFKNALETVCGKIYPKDGRILWLNLRQEPNIYINGESICARPPSKVGEFAELGDITRTMVISQENQFKKVVELRAKEGDGKLKYFDIDKKEHEVAVKDVKSLSETIEDLKEDFPGLLHMRVPVVNSAAPKEADFDTICQALVGTSINTPIIINDQAGLSRATTGCVIACLFKEFQINASFEGLVETVPGVNVEVLRMDNYTMDPKKDPLFKGEFPVVVSLVNNLNDGAAAKNECDKVIDKNGTPKTGGTGLKQIRENIAESKLSYEIMDDTAQAFLKVKIMDNIHKYFYLISFTAYMRESANLARNAVAENNKAAVTLTGGKCAIPGDKLKLQKTFASFMDEHSELREMIERGKGDLQWERDIPASALENLEKLAGDDFRENLGLIIHDIYQTAHTMFSDMPQGDHKKRAKYRFASKTLMRILPCPVKEEVEALIDAKVISLDLYEILGKCTWKDPSEEIVETPKVNEDMNMTGAEDGNDGPQEKEEEKCR